MIVGLGTGSVFANVVSATLVLSPALTDGEFLATDTGLFFTTHTGQYMLTNVEIRTIQTSTSLDLATHTGDTMTSYRLDGNVASASDPE